MMNKHPESDEIPDRDQLATEYFDLLPYPPYPVQEEAMLSYFTGDIDAGDQGVLVGCRRERERP